MHRQRRLASCLPQTGSALVALTLAAWVPAVAQSAGASAASAGGVRLAYGDAPEQHGELRVPDGAGPFPVAIILHGGCFLAGMATARHTAEFADSLRHSGIATWNVEYRRVDSPGGGWPGTYLDVGRAADHVRVLARSHPLDTTRVIAVGHSAGGFLALWLGGRSALPRSAALYAANPLPLRAVVALGGDGDLPPIAPALARVCRVPVVEQLLGTDSATMRSRRAQGNPADMPASRVRQLLVSGDRDRFETPELRDGYAARARAKGESVEVVTLPGADHFAVANPKAAVWPSIRDLLVSLVKVSP